MPVSIFFVCVCGYVGQEGRMDGGREGGKEARTLV